MERERDEAERQRDDYEAGYRTYAAKCEELQTELNAAQDTIKRQAIDHIATIAELAETRATPPPPPEEERR
jgi:chromosome segregation ATPase